MTLSLSILKAGDSVRLRCGGVLEVVYTKGCSLYFKGYFGSWSYDLCGIMIGNGTAVEPQPFDIVEIIPKKEPLKREYWINLYGLS